MSGNIISSTASLEFCGQHCTSPTFLWKRTPRLSQMSLSTSYAVPMKRILSEFRRTFLFFTKNKMSSNELKNIKNACFCFMIAIWKNYVLVLETKKPSQNILITMPNPLLHQTTVRIHVNRSLLLRHYCLNHPVKADKSDW